ncbi:regulatory protein, luxR family [Chryseobacterium arachidis]|uniref:Regulatory protein, luxR family n=1 Tax=Chryseobacterium arachidis TaxID=1416778 RepID=A0A1M5FNX3_9FLAO|nr:helix-turn-helix transcriptional regulator [Chryseobacterium arachidis]SHF93193.1 regulatory protein, luxR family [Chryseobacterium arachidis]
MEIVHTLNKTLLKKDHGRKCLLDIEVYKNIALGYVKTEHCLAVLSDMQYNKSFIFSSKTAVELGLYFNENPAVIDSIWEEEILKKIHPDDKIKKYIHELRFFELLETMKPEDRSDFSVLSRLRMKGKGDTYKFVKHRMFYFYSPENTKLRFALCLYNIDLGPSVKNSEFLIVNSVKGKIISEDELVYKNILTKRELEVLKYIGEGFISKEIAGLLSISINTVNRHRQNILEKLKVKNSIMAVAENLAHKTISQESD